jgi:integration host factor subunit alpha
MLEELVIDHKTLTKADIVEHIHRKIGFSKKDSAEICEKVFEVIKKTLERGESVKLSGFGKFDVKQKRSRRGRNPQTGEEIQISARKVLSFKASQILRKKLVD